MTIRIIISNVILTLFFLSPSFSQKAVTGLWEVSSVQVGNESMTPQGRWTELKSDGTHSSGNGWKKHSEGTWSYDNSENSIAIVNKNGIRDPYGKFDVNISDTSMTWKRLEEGEVVVVSFKRIEALPKIDSDKLLGVWLLETSAQDEEVFLFFRWDNIVVHNLNVERQNNFYRVHGHRNNITIISLIGEQKSMSFDFKFENEKLVLIDGNSSQKFIRINYVP